MGCIFSKETWNRREMLEAKKRFRKEAFEEAAKMANKARIIFRPNGTFVYDADIGKAIRDLKEKE